MSPESHLTRIYITRNQSYVARNFMMLNNIVTTFYKAYFVSSVLKERKLYYKFILLVSFHQFVSSKVNEGDMLHTNPVCLASSSLEELTTYALDEILGDITLTGFGRHIVITFGETRRDPARRQLPTLNTVSALHLPSMTFSCNVSCQRQPQKGPQCYF